MSSYCGTTLELTLSNSSCNRMKRVNKASTQAFGHIPICSVDAYTKLLLVLPRRFQFFVVDMDSNSSAS